MLTVDQIHNFKKQLDDRFFDLCEEVRLELLKSDNETYIELAGRVHDIGDASVADLLVDLQLADIDRHINEIRDIDAALLRIATGSYGVCSDCRASIAVERLQAYPNAKRCYRCQDNHEHTYAGGGRSSL